MVFEVSKFFASEWLIMVLIKFTRIPRLQTFFFYFQKIQLCFRIDGDVEIYFLFLFFDKVLMDLLEPKLKENADILSRREMNLKTRASALVSSLAIVILVKKYKPELRREYKLTLLDCLSLEADPTEKKCSIYEVVLAEFSEGLRK